MRSWSCKEGRSSTRPARAVSGEASVRQGASPISPETSGIGHLARWFSYLFISCVSKSLILRIFTLSLLVQTSPHVRITSAAPIVEHQQHGQ